MIKLREILRNTFKREELEHYNVHAFLKNEESGLVSVHLAHNIVTTAGDVHIAQEALSETPTNVFTPGSLYLYSASITPGKSSTHVSASTIGSTEKANEAGYPKTNDSDTDNTGKAADAMTRKYFYNAASFNAVTIAGGGIGKSSIANGNPLYAAWDFAASFGKTSSDTLTIYHNSNVTGV